MPKNPTPPLTLSDPHKGKTAALDDGPGVRSLLAGVVERLAPFGNEASFSKDATERVAQQILRRTGDLKSALSTIRGGTLAAIFQGTDIYEDAKKIRESGKRPDELPGLHDDAARDKAAEDILEAWALIWPTFREAIERRGGEEKQRASLSVEFVPETEEADAYIEVKASTVVGTKSVTRSTKVRKLKTGRHQLEFWGGRVE